VACAALAVAGCADSGESAAPSPEQGPLAAFSGEYPYSIVTTTGMVSDIVAQVAGERAEVRGLLGTGVDPHLYKPTRDAVARLMDADVVFYSGLMLEGRMADTFTRVQRSGKPVFAVTEGLPEDRLREPPELEGHWDPHVWMDVAAWSECVGFVAEALSGFDPAGASSYRENAEAYRGQLAELDAYVRRVTASIPDDRRVLVTAHDAFGYFSAAYGIPVRSVQGITTESEPAVSDINALVDFIVDRGVGAIFVESTVNPKNIQAIIEGAAQRGRSVRVGGELYSDAMGAPGTYQGTYIGMIDHNATTIARALGGEAPAGGFSGQLVLEIGTAE
jgi:manganese/zinc/iron transport system substrate-binding protein